MNYEFSTSKKFTINGFSGLILAIVIIYTTFTLVGIALCGTNQATDELTSQWFLSTGQSCNSSSTQYILKLFK